MREKNNPVWPNAVQNDTYQNYATWKEDIIFESIAF